MVGVGWVPIDEEDVADLILVYRDCIHKEACDRMAEVAGLRVPKDGFSEESDRALAYGCETCGCAGFLD